MAAAAHIATQGMQKWLDVVGDKHCVKALVVPLENHPEFVKWALDAGTMRLPKTLQERELTNHAHEYDTYTGEDVWNEEADGDADGDDDAVAPVIDFPELISIVDDFLKNAEGAGIYAMSDTKSPYDATWAVASGEKLQCGCTSEVFSLLKASDNVTDDWHTRAEAGLPLHLVLRKWYSMDQGMCFRGFVQGDVLRGVSQKRLSEFYPYLLELKDEICAAAKKVFEEAIKGKVADEEYSFDFYIVRTTLRAKVLGFHGWGEKDMLMFDPEDLRTSSLPASGVPHLHIIECRDDIADCGVSRGMRSAIPEDLKDMANLVQAAENVDARSGGEVKMSVDDMIRMMKEAEQAQ